MKMAKKSQPKDRRRSAASVHGSGKAMRRSEATKANKAREAERRTERLLRAAERRTEVTHTDPATFSSVEVWKGTKGSKNLIAAPNGIRTRRFLMPEILARREESARRINVKQATRIRLRSLNPKDAALARARGDKQFAVGPDRNEKHFTACAPKRLRVS